MLDIAYEVIIKLIYFTQLLIYYIVVILADIAYYFYFTRAI